jgi:hypothetical protein
VSPDFSQRINNLRFGEWLSRDRVFHKEEEIYSPTLKAACHA